MKKLYSFLQRENFLLFKIVLWVGLGLLFIGFSFVIPTVPNVLIKELIVFLCLAITVNIHTSYLYPTISKKSKWSYIVVLIGSILICTGLEFAFFLKIFNTIYSTFPDKRQIYLAILGYIFIRNFAVFIFFLWIEYFNRLIFLHREKERVYQQEMALLIEKQEFDKQFSRKKLLSHYFFNILEHFYADSLANHSDSKLLDKAKFLLYYFLVDAEKEKVELDKELAFYSYYIELEKFRFQKNMSVSFNALGQTENFMIIPLLFEPLIGNALKYTKHDGTGWVDIMFDATCFPTLKFRCKNNYDHRSSNIVSSENGLKILEQRLELCYKNKYVLKIEQFDDLYEVVLSVETV